MRKISVHILDDHAIITDGLRSSINNSAVAEVSGVSGTVEACRNALSYPLKPDVLLLDVTLSENEQINGIDFCAEVRKAYPTVKVLILTGHQVYSLVKRALKAGAHGYILKDTPTDEVIEGMLAVIKGETFLCKKTSAIMKQHTPEQDIWLTKQEIKVLRLTADGYNAKDIGEEIFRAATTVESIRSNLLDKFDAKNVAELIKKAIEGKWI